ncbi:MAG TPA: flagellar hook capping FlgD N-terminal domain-containing protein [Pseudolabrys sp.]|nr:flagellar hook capping FlgD N-terminal domain-containing protein [Pseudolabrys sp.]
MTAISNVLPTSATTASTTANAGDAAEIASNFTQFLQLLTTQLKNQDPLSPMDTNQFTQQLVEFSQVEQQLKTNSSLSTLVTLQQSAQATSALELVGATVVVNGANAQLTPNGATWTLNATKPANATISIANSTGQTVYTGSFAVSAGPQTFTWDGHGNDGRLWPAGTYTLTASAVDASGQSTAISTQVQAPVDSVDLTQNPPVLSINGQNYTMNQLQKIVSR